MDNMQPGQIIIPHGSTPPEPPEPHSNPAPEPQRPTEPEPPAPAPSPQPEPAQEPQLVAEQSVGWQFNGQVADDAVLDERSDSEQPLVPEELSWTASEFIAHEKSPSWYGLLALAGFGGSILMYLLTRDIISTVIVVLVTITFGYFAARKPITQQYELTIHGLRVGAKTYGFESFKSFSLAEEGALASIIFMPLKRFMPPLTMYVAPEMEDQVINFLSSCLPFEHHKPDAVDTFMKRIRF